MASKARRPLSLLTPRTLAGPLRLLARVPRLRALTGASLGFAAAQGSVLTFLTTVATEKVGLSLATAGALFATLQGASVAGRIGFGLLSARPREVLVGLGCASALGIAAMASAGPGFPFGCCSRALRGWGPAWRAGTASSSPRSPLRRRRATAQATSAATFFTFLAYMATPPIFAGLALGIGWGLAWASAGAAVLASTWVLARDPGAQ